MLEPYQGTSLRIMLLLRLLLLLLLLCSNDIAVIPPGHYVENEGAEIYTVTACKDDEYQEDWVKPKVATATKCLKCGAGILSDAIIPLKFPRVGTAGGNADVEELSINIRGSSDACCE